MSIAVDVVAIIELAAESPEENGDDEGGWVMGRIRGDGIVAAGEREMTKRLVERNVDCCLIVVNLTVGGWNRRVKVAEASEKLRSGIGEGN